MAAILAVIVALAGFFLTYLQPISEGRFVGPKWSHIHGALAIGWLLLVVAQSWLARGRINIHRKLGWAALLIAPLLTASTVAIAVEAAQREVSAGGGETVISAVLGSLTSSAIFVLLVLAAVTLRAKPQVHKRIIFIATVAILWPAWFRWRHFLPGAPRPEITLALVLANTPILIAMLRDRLRFGAVHPVYRWLGVGFVIEQGIEAVLFDSPAWRAVATAIYNLFL